MVPHVLAAVVGAVIAMAGANKVAGFARWRADARSQGIWDVIAVPLPAVELLLGCLLVVLRPHPLTLGAATLLLLVFTSYLVVRVASRSTVPCACFGSLSRRPPGARDVLRNLVMIGVLVVAAALG